MGQLARYSPWRVLFILLAALIVFLVFLTSGGSTKPKRTALELAASTKADNSSEQSVCLILAPSPNLTQFVDALPIIPIINVSTGEKIVMKAFTIHQKLHRDLPPTRLYGFGTSESNAQYPGPALQATRNVRSRIRWENHIADEQHFLALDKTILAALPRRGGVPIVTHLHGMELEPKYDGHPEAWFTKYGETGPRYVTQDYEYLNTVLPSMLWYHDHSIGITRLNLAAGLAGPYVVRGSKHEEPTSLPKGDQEIFLFIQDKQLFANGSINFPSVGDDVTMHPVWCPGYYGDTMVVNGKVWPYHEVFPFKYRLRILNGASERFLDLQINHGNKTLPFHKIGTDGGYLRSSVRLNHLVLSPGERIDCVVDFTGLKAGDRVLLNNTGNVAYPGGPPLDAGDKMRAVLEFRIVANSTADRSRIPKNLSDYSPPVVPAANRTRFRHFILTETINNAGNGTELLLANRSFQDPVTEISHLGATEIWQFISLTPSVAHPIHLHLVKFHVLDVQPMDTGSYLNSTCSLIYDYGQPGSCFLGPSRPPDPQEIGWKDIASAWPGNVTRILVTFRSQDGSAFGFDPTGEPGFLWHCHLLSHEDNSMMRPMNVVY
ncbi:spore coat protein A, manganese oxidase [Marchantia polymorpha subsp. ruderalis]